MDNIIFHLLTAFFIYFLVNKILIHFQLLIIALKYLKYKLFCLSILNFLKSTTQNSKSILIFGFV